MITKDDTFTLWFPFPSNELASMYDVYRVILGPVGVTVIMIPDGPRKNEFKCIKLSWSSFVAYQVSEETFRNDCWVTAQQEQGAFFISKNSLCLQTFQKNSILFPKDTMHYLLVGTNLIFDVLSAEAPLIEYCDL